MEMQQECEKIGADEPQQLLGRSNSKRIQVSIRPKWGQYIIDASLFAVILKNKRAILG
jgi:hypothetical protein